MASWNTESRNRPERNLAYATIFATIIIVLLLAWPTVIGAQPECTWIDGEWLCISHIEATLTPFVPTNTPVPTVAPPTPTPTIVIQPFPTATPMVTVYTVYVPLVHKTIVSGEVPLIYR